MDSPTLTALLAIALAAATVSAFVAYWMGMAHAERASAQREDDLVDALDDATATILRLSRERHPAGKDRHLRLIGGGA